MLGMVQNLSVVAVNVKIIFLQFNSILFQETASMNHEILYAIIFLGIFLLLIAVAHFLYRFFNLPSETSRKFLHVSGGMLALCSPLFFSSHKWVLILCCLAFLLLLFTYLKHWLPSIHQTERKSIGSVVYPIPIYICFFFAMNKANNLLFYLPISLLTVSDTVAELAGKKWGYKSKSIMNRTKTTAGSAGFAISAFVISIAWAAIFEFPVQQIMFLSITITLMATLAEMVSTKGWDNISVPLITLGFLLALLND
jgi:phytol kinase